MSDAKRNEIQELSQEEMNNLQGGDCTRWSEDKPLPGCQVDETYLIYGYYKGTTENP